MSDHHFEPTESQLPCRVASGMVLPQHLAHLFGVHGDEDANGIPLQFDADGLSYQSTLDGQLRSLRIDFLNPSLQHRKKQDRGGIGMLLKALGRPEDGTEIVDGTTGLGEDSYVLASFGYQMTCIERNPAVHALLVDAHDRLKSVEPEIADKIRLYQNQVQNQALKEKLVYLDPMFPERKKSALPHIEMRLLAKITDCDIEQLPTLLPVLEQCPKRIVVKRPLRGPPLEDIEPAHAIVGKAIRFDVYLPR